MISRCRDDTRLSCCENQRCNTKETDKLDDFRHCDDYREVDNAGAIIEERSDEAMTI
jgi:hypothetical protein